jgi:hypothetical protein
MRKKRVCALREAYRQEDPFGRKPDRSTLRQIKKAFLAERRKGQWPTLKITVAQP